MVGDFLLAMKASMPLLCHEGTDEVVAEAEEMEERLSIFAVVMLLKIVMEAVKLALQHQDMKK